MSYKRGDLQKIEKLFSENNYKVRYEKGNFKSGYCLVKQSRIVVINKFYDVNARAKCLFEIKAILDFSSEGPTKKEAEHSLFTELSPEVVAV